QQLAVPGLNQFRVARYFEVRDVLVVGEEALDFSLVIPDHPGRSVDVDQRAILFFPERLVRGDAAFEDFALDYLFLLQPVRRNDQLRDRTAERFGAGIAEDNLGASIPV